MVWIVFAVVIVLGSLVAVVWLVRGRDVPGPAEPQPEERTPHVPHPPAVGEPPPLDDRGRPVPGSGPDRARHGKP